MIYGQIHVFQINLRPGSFGAEAKLIGVCKQQHKQPCLPSGLYRNSSPTSGLQEGQSSLQKLLSQAMVLPEEKSKFTI